jgi:serine/threonine protein kinase
MSQLGSGTFSNVYLSKKNTALKEFKNNSFNSSAEIDILFRIKSKYIVAGIDVYYKDSSFTIEMNFAGINIHNYFEINNKLTCEQSITIIHDIASGLKCLHDNNYFHLDLTSRNVLLNKYHNVVHAKIIDFGLSYLTERYLGELIPLIVDETPRISEDFRPIENLPGIDPTIVSDPDLSKVYSDKSDIWSLGIIAFHLFTNGKWFKTKDYKNIYRKILHKEFIANELLECDSKDAISFVECTLNSNPPARPNISQILQHSLFTGKETEPFVILDIDYEFSENYDLSHLEKLKYLIKLFRYYNKLHPVRFLFLGIDIYFRLCPYFIAISKIDTHLIHRLVDRFISGDCDRSASNPETYILHSLNGRLYRRHLYEICRGISDLIYLYKKFVVNAGYNTINEYLELNLDSISEEIKKEVQDPGNSKLFEINIGSFFESVT